MIQVKKRFLRAPVVGAAILGGLSLSACATTDYVDHRIAEVNDRISAVDAKATAADQKADQALSAATQANQRIDSLTTTVNSMQQAPPPPAGRSPHG